MSSSSGSGIPDSAALHLNRREGTIIYECYAKPYNAPIKSNVDPVVWSPAKLKYLSAEVLRRNWFLQDFSEAGGLKKFGPGNRFNGAMVRAVAEEPFFSFMTRVTTWLKSNPRPLLPALPEPPRRSSSWSVQDLVHNHRYYVPTPEKKSN